MTIDQVSVTSDANYTIDITCQMLNANSMIFDNIVM